MEEQIKQLSVEELQNAVAELSTQNQYLQRQMASMNNTNVFKRLDYLFKVVENASVFSEDFVAECTEEIQLAISLKSVEEETPKVE